MGSINTESWPPFILLKNEETQANEAYDKTVEEFRSGSVSKDELTQAWIRKQQAYDRFKAFRDDMFS
ncbi:hypothetical protein C408_3502 [Vibrio diabolicus E0666]|uniref:hypothetical protein n=1 Tax=Vibrio diabolicus TaxID=50719 RepID=UPI0002B70027|nr:hypothetical protein [Vibrio diabolicus]EMD78083.1 hypothetical protein C408_3502 [Vibrio diabolicus E0666]